MSEHHHCPTCGTPAPWACSCNTDRPDDDDLPGRLEERARQHREFKRYRVSVDYTDRDADRDERAAVRIRELEAENARLHGLTEGDPSSVYFELADARSRVQELEQKVDDWRVSVQLLEAADVLEAQAARIRELEAEDRDWALALRIRRGLEAERDALLDAVGYRTYEEWKHRT